MITLVLLRHGQTDWNVQHRYQGRSDIPLNHVGELQAIEANKKLKGYHFDAVYCSDMDRAKRTAKLALKGIFPYEKVQFDRRLRERSFGIFEGGPYDKDKVPENYLNAMNADPEGFCFPQGESLLDVEKRVRPFYDEIIKKHDGETILLVAHGSLLSILRFIVDKEPVLDKNRRRLPNAEPIELKIS